MATIIDFYHGARPKTLSAALAPVFIGSAFAISNNNYSIDLIIGCLMVSIALQVGVNYANDYSDGIKGTDDNRVGPIRLVGSGLAAPKSVFLAMVTAFCIAGISGIYVSMKSSPYLIILGVFCVGLAYLYTGTKYAYGYIGLGELAVFVCFGIVATVGTYFVNTKEINFTVVVASFIPGLFSVAILLANNIRDISTDKIANKKTLAVRLGSKRSILLFKIVIWLVPLSILIVGMEYEYAFIALVTSLFVYILTKKISQADNPKDYISILVRSSKANMITSTLVSLLVIVS